MVTDWMDFIASQDPEVGAGIRAEFDRQCRNIELIASENFVSEAVLAAAGTVLTNKYAEGYPGKRYRECGDRGLGVLYPYLCPSGAEPDPGS